MAEEIVLQLGAVGLQGVCVTIHLVYCDRSRGLLAGELYCKTTGCIVTG